MRKFALVLGAVLLVAGTASAQPVQLDISSGFTVDVCVGPLEMQGIYTYNAVGDGRLNSNIGALQDLTTGQYYRYYWGICNGYGNEMWIASSSEAGYGEPYSIPGQWFHPTYYGVDTDTDMDGYPEEGSGLCEDGVVAGSSFEYHMASVLGNATLAGDWTEAVPVFPDPDNPVSGDGMAVKFNAMMVGAGHATATMQIIETTATLPVAQQGNYVNINFVMQAGNVSDRARYMRIVAIYADGEEELYAFDDNDGGSGPQAEEADPGAEWNLVYTAQRRTNGYQGPGLEDKRFWEFAEPLALNSTRTLTGIKIYDSNPTDQYDSRWLAFYAATALEAGEAGDPDADLSLIEADPNLIPDDESAPSTVTISLKDEFGIPVPGLAADITINVSGDGTSTIGVVSEVSDGVYEATFTNDTAGEKILTATVDLDPDPDVTTVDTATVVVYTPGVSGPPLADAGVDQIVTDTDDSGDEDVDLDGSASMDGDGTIDSYSWVEGGTEIATGANPTVNMGQGAHLITLTCTDNDGYTDSDDLWVVVVAPGGDPNAVQLDISSGFTQDCLWGAMEMRAIYWYAVSPDPDLDGIEAQGSLYANGQAGWSVFGQYNSDCSVGNDTVDTYTTYHQWWHPDYISGDEGFPESGYIAGTSVDYYMASTGGNPIMPMDMLSAADDVTLAAQLGPGGYACGNGMDVQLNVMGVGTAYSSANWANAEATATLPVAQQDMYDGVNVVLCAYRGCGERGRYMRLEAIYTDDSTDLLWAWDDTADDTPWASEMDTLHADYTLVVSNTQMYSPGSGSTGGIGNRDEALYEFASFLDLDETKTLKALRLYDSNPTANYQARGIGIFAATAVYELPTVADPPDCSVATEDGLDWVYQNYPGSIANGGHNVALTVTVNDLMGNSAVTVTVAKQAASGPGEVVVSAGANDLEKLIGGSDRTAGTNGSLVLEVTCQGDVAPVPTVLTVPFSCNILGDVDGNGGAEPQDVSLLINKLNGVGNGGFHDRAFDIDANGGAEPGDVSILINVLNGVL